MSTKWKPTEYAQHNNFDPAARTTLTAVTCPEETLTDQSFKDDADINVILERYGVLGTVPLNPRVPMYGDFTGITDYRESIQAVQNAVNQFMQLPAKVRARFNNDPQELLEFMADDNNLEEARALGLANREAEPTKAPNTTTQPAPKTTDATV